MFNIFGNLFSKKSAISEDFYDQLEEALIMGDTGAMTTEKLLDEMRERVEEDRIKDPEMVENILKGNMKDIVEVPEDAYKFEDVKSVVLVLGVNGVGKTTTVGKLAGLLKKNGKSVMIAAADTFRAAAGEQLKTWAARADVPMIGGQEGADPASIVFDAVASARAKDIDVLLIDTAGRLHNKKNLMSELHKIATIVEKQYPEAIQETLLVLDATTGQNGAAQVKEFKECVPNLTGIVLTKMDGTAKGGIAVSICDTYHIPVKYIGTGEKIDDFRRFSPNWYIRELFKQEEV